MENVIMIAAALLRRASPILLEVVWLDTEMMIFNKLL